MSFKPTQQQIIDFVYGELPEAERVLMAQAIKEDDALRAEIDGLSGSRSFLHNLADEEVLEPERLLWKIVSKQKKSARPWAWLAVAASLVLLLVVGYATQFRLQYGAFELAFGHSETMEQSVVLTNEQVQAMINKSIIATKVDFETQLKETKSEFGVQLAANNVLQLKDMQRIAANVKVVPDKEMNTYLAQLNETNRTMLNDFFTVSAIEQQDYINAILTDYFEYMDEKRKDDFQILQANIDDVDYKNDVRTQQTDQVIASILTTVGGGSMGQ